MDRQGDRIGRDADDIAPALSRETIRQMAAEYGMVPSFAWDGEEVDLVLRERSCGLALEWPFHGPRRGRGLSRSFSAVMLASLEKLEAGKKSSHSGPLST